MAVFSTTWTDDTSICLHIRYGEVLSCNYVLLFPLFKFSHTLYITQHEEDV
jgi:hypothetical protein